MNAELLYTSAPQGLKQGSRGFCTVLSTAGMPINLAQKLESLSGYRHLYPPKDPQAHRNPVAYSHLRFPVGGRTLSVLSRISDYGLDYSDRTNKIAHHIAVDAPLPSSGPAALLLHPGLMRTAWDQRCETLAEGPRLPSLAVEPAVCRAWQALTGDAGWAGVVAQAWLDATPKPTFLVHSEDQSPALLGLLAEALALLPPNKRWGATFSTYVTTLPPDVECRVRCVVAGSEEARMATARGQVINLTKSLGMAPAIAGAVAARAGSLISGALPQSDDAAGAIETKSLVVPLAQADPSAKKDAVRDPWVDTDGGMPQQSAEGEEEEYEFQEAWSQQTSASPPQFRRTKSKKKLLRSSVPPSFSASPSRRQRNALIAAAVSVILLSLVGGVVLLFSGTKQHSAMTEELPKQTAKSPEPSDVPTRRNEQEQSTSSPPKSSQIPEQSDPQPMDPQHVESSVPNVGSLPSEPNPLSIPSPPAAQSPFPAVNERVIVGIHGVKLKDIDLVRPVLGAVLTAAEVPGVSGFQWQRNKDGEWKDIADCTSDQYVVTEQDFGCEIQCMAKQTSASESDLDVGRKSVRLEYAEVFIDIDECIREVASLAVMGDLHVSCQVGEVVDRKKYDMRYFSGESGFSLGSARVPSFRCKLRDLVSDDVVEQVYGRVSQLAQQHGDFIQERSIVEKVASNAAQRGIALFQRFEESLAGVGFGDDRFVETCKSWNRVADFCGQFREKQSMAKGKEREQSIEGIKKDIMRELKNIDGVKDADIHTFLNGGLAIRFAEVWSGPVVPREDSRNFRDVFLELQVRFNELKHSITEAKNSRSIVESEGQLCVVKIREESDYSDPTSIARKVSQKDCLATVPLVLSVGFSHSERALQGGIGGSKQGPRSGVTAGASAPGATAVTNVPQD